MTEKLKAYLDGLFESVPATEDVLAAKDELYDGMIERYEDCLKEGMDEQAAYDCVVDSIGDIRELIDELDTGEAEEPKAEEKTKSGAHNAGFDLGQFVNSITDFAGGLVSGLFSNAVVGEEHLANSMVLPVQDVASIDIRYVSEELRLFVGEEDSLVINEYLNRDDPALFATASITGDNITVRHGHRSGVFGLRSRVEVFLPASWEGRLSVSTVSGRIKCNDALKVASLNAKTVSGELELDDVTANVMRLSSTAGSIRVGKAAGTLDLGTISGSVLVEEARGSGTATTTSGSIRVYFKELSGNVKASSISGGVRLGIPAGAAFALDAKSVSGSIHTAFDGQLTYRKWNNASGTVGEEPFHEVKISTTSGGIHIND